MAEEEIIPAQQLEITTLDAPTFVVDGAIGAALVGDLHRILLGEFVVNLEPGAEKPKARVIANLVISTPALRYLIDYLQSLPGVRDDAE